ncbi:repressor LexA [Candidatus Peregrinibacteria bacterium]|nr:repressor LexA [Candidatus Peregrinibacteria bacterium]
MRPSTKDDPLTKKQEAVLKFIEEYQMENGKSPILREMCKKFKYKSDNSILKHLAGLQKKGHITMDGTPRGIGLLPSVREKLHGETGLKLPVLGFIPAGGPVFTEEYINNWVSVDEGMAKNSRDFFLVEVTGNSMIDAGIFEGDLVVVNSKKEPRNGDIVVALVDNQNTLKRFVKEGGKVYLKAENKEYDDIYPLNELTAQGVVTALIRKYQ